MSRTTEFKRNEMIQIKKEFPDCSLDYLFATEDERGGEHSCLVTVHTSTCIIYREVVEMKEIKVINALDIDGKETPFSELTVEDQKQMAGKIRDTVMNFVGYRRKTA